MRQSLDIASKPPEPSCAYRELLTPMLYEFATVFCFNTSRSMELLICSSLCLHFICSKPWPLSGVGSVFIFQEGSQCPSILRDLNVYRGHVSYSNSGGDVAIIVQPVHNLPWPCRAQLSMSHGIGLSFAPNCSLPNLCAFARPPARPLPLAHF